MTITRKKLIEVALPLEAINAAAKEEKSVPRRGHPQTLHYWWARRPLAAARAVTFAQMIDDPSAVPEEFPTEAAQAAERNRLFDLIGHIVSERDPRTGRTKEAINGLVAWENTSNERVLQAAREEIWRSWRRACADNRDHPRATELYNPGKLPPFRDPFAGGGTLPLEAQRLGLEAHASDLNPIAVLINKALIEVPARFTGQRPINPESRRGRGSMTAKWRGVSGLAEDIRYYGEWVRNEAARRIGHHYPKVVITPSVAEDRPDLKPLVGRELTVIAWLWARTVKSPNPAFRDVDVPLATTFMLSERAGKETFVEPVIEDGSYRFTVRTGTGPAADAARQGTKMPPGANFRCVMSGAPIAGPYIMAEGRKGALGAKLMAMVAESETGRVYLPPNSDLERLARHAQPEWQPDEEFFQQALGFRVGNYGLTQWSDLFTSRQLVAMSTFSDVITEAIAKVRLDAAAVFGESAVEHSREYSRAVALYLGCALSRLATYNNTICVWNMRGGSVAQIFGRQTISMSWDFIEINPLEKVSGNWTGAIEWIADVVQSLPSTPSGYAVQLDATSYEDINDEFVISTDPPYYDNIGYADLSDFFYVWLRRALKPSYPDLFETIAVPKDTELVATPARHGGKVAAEEFFLDGMTQAMQGLSKASHPSFPITIYYAFKQSETDSKEGTSSTGWETFLGAVISAGLMILGTWPMRTERSSRLRGQLSNALASSIVLVCRPRPSEAPIATRSQFLAALRGPSGEERAHLAWELERADVPSERRDEIRRLLSDNLPSALVKLQQGNIAPVDLAQAAIGPGMAIFTRYVKVLDASGESMKVRDALALINQILDEALAEQEGDFDADSRWALAWFEQMGFNDGQYGTAETLSTAKNTSVAGLAEAGIVSSARGVVRLLRPAELNANWDPKRDERLTAWESVHQLVRALETGGESAAAELAAKLGSHAETARELCYRLYTLCERKKRASEALSYNALVQSWPEIMRLAQETPRDQLQGTLI